MYTIHNIYKWLDIYWQFCFFLSSEFTKMSGRQWISVRRRRQQASRGLQFTGVHPTRGTSLFIMMPSRPSRIAFPSQSSLMVTSRACRMWRPPTPSQGWMVCVRSTASPHGWSLSDTCTWYLWISAGVMAARGLLANPAMFAGYEETPLQCVWDWVDIAVEHGTPFSCFHHHLIYMLERITSQPERRVFNNLSSTSAVIDFLRNTYGST